MLECVAAQWTGGERAILASILLLLLLLLLLGGYDPVVTCPPSLVSLLHKQGRRGVTLNIFFSGKLSRNLQIFPIFWKELQIACEIFSIFRKRFGEAAQKSVTLPAKA